MQIVHVRNAPIDSQILKTAIKEQSVSNTLHYQTSLGDLGNLDPFQKSKFAQETAAVTFQKSGQCDDAIYSFRIRSPRNFVRQEHRQILQLFYLRSKMKVEVIIHLLPNEHFKTWINERRW